MELENFSVQIIKHLDLQPGDMLVFSMPGRASGGERDRFVAYTEKLFSGMKVVLMDGGLKCDGVLRLGNSEAQE